MQTENDMPNSKRVYFSTTRPLSRRHFLRGTGAAAIGLPLLDAMFPCFGRAAHGAESSENAPHRFVALCATLGFHTPFLFPETSGADYELTPYLKQLESHRDQITVLSGLDHPEQQGNNGHASELTWLTSAQHPGLASFQNTISLDQLIAEKIGHLTRFPYLALSTNGRSLSWTGNGVEIPGETAPSKVFKALFVDGSEREIQEEIRNLDRGRSILDTVQQQASKLNKKLGLRDREKLDEYFSAVRDLETRLQQSQAWVSRPKPKVDVKPPVDVAERTNAIAQQDLMYDMIVLALQTDSTRNITFQMAGMNAVPQISGVKTDWHQLSHHGKDPAKIEELKIIEEAEFAAFNRFLTKMRTVQEHDRTLLDHTTVFFGSNLGNASSHSSANIPLVLAGGGFKHGQHVAHDPQKHPPLANLFVTFAQQMGLEIDRFGTSTAAGISGLEAV